MPGVLIPGVAEDARLWEDVLAGDRALRVADPRAPAGAADPGLIERYGAAVVAQLGAEPEVIVGHSLGGLVALEVARRVPVRGLVLVGCGLPLAVNPVLVRLAEEDPEAALELIVSAATGGRRGAVGAGKEAVAARLRAQMRGVDPARTAAELRAADAYDPSVWLPTLAVPAVVLAGSVDRMLVPGAAATLAAGLGGRLETIAGAGHQLPWEAPERILAAIAAL